MYNKKIMGFCLLIMISLSPLLTSAQDVVYKIDGTRVEGQIKSIDGALVEYTMLGLSGSQSRFVNQLEIAFIFLTNGQYLVFPLENDKLADIRQLPKPNSDVLVTKFAELIEGNIQSLENNKATVLVKNSNNTLEIGFEDLVFAIFNTGKHAIFTKPSDGVGIMGFVKEKVRQASVQSASIDNEIINPSARPTYVREITTGLAEKNPDNQQAKPAENKNSSQFSDLDFYEFSDKAMQKIDDLSNYIAIIANKSTETSRSNDAINLAVDLFVSEESTVEVSTVGFEAVVTRQIREYLTRLKLLKYDKVEISWADINYVSNFRRGVDGNYYGTVSVKQTFSGFLENRLAYSDVTEKEIEVVIKAMDKMVEGESTSVWDVLLSDIGVRDTRSR